MIIKKFDLKKKDLKIFTQNIDKWKVYSIYTWQSYLHLFKRKILIYFYYIQIEKIKGNKQTIIGAFFFITDISFFIKLNLSLFQDRIYSSDYKLKMGFYLL